MSTKRLMKKENQRTEALGHRLEDLYRRGADEAFLDLVHERCRSLPDLPAAGLHGEVVDRVLRRALMVRDWHRTGRILKRLRRDVVGGRPMVRLAEAALHLVEGRLDEARAGLAGLTAAGNGAAPVPACLVTALEALTIPDAPGQGGSSQYVWELARRLELLREQEFRATPQDIRSFEVILAALEVGIAGDAAAGKLLSAAGERLRLLDQLGVLERDLLRDHPDGGLTVLDIFLEEISEESRSLLEAFRAAPPWNLVRPLHHAARLAWRSLLQIVAEKEGAEAWAEVASVWHELLSLDLEDETGVRIRVTGGLWLEWKEALALARFRKLAELLESKGRLEKDPERLADLWTVELTSWQWAARSVPYKGNEVVTPVRAVIDRLMRLTKEMGQRIPPEQRPALARRFREHLLWLLEVEPLRRRTCDAAMALLAHLDEDPVLLAVALVSAALTGDEQARDRLAARISVPGPVSGEDGVEVLAVITCLYRERWPLIVQSLSQLRPLLEGEIWDDAIHEASQYILDDILGEITRGGALHPLHFQRELEVARAGFPDLIVLRALENALLCLTAGESPEKPLLSFLERESSLEGALMIYLMLHRALAWKPELLPALSRARVTAIDRLDQRVRVWRRHLQALYDDATPEEVHRLRERLHLLQDLEAENPTPAAMVPVVLADVLGQIDLWQARNRMEEELPDEDLIDDGDDWDDDEEDDEDWDEDDWEEDDDEDTKEYPLPDISVESLQQALERLFPPPRLVMKSLEPAPGPLQLQDLQPLLRPMRRQAVEEALRVGLKENRT